MGGQLVFAAYAASGVATESTTATATATAALNSNINNNGSGSTKIESEDSLQGLGHLLAECVAEAAGGIPLTNVHVLVHPRTREELVAPFEETSAERVPHLQLVEAMHVRGEDLVWDLVACSAVDRSTFAHTKASVAKLLLLPHVRMMRAASSSWEALDDALAQRATSLLTSKIAKSPILGKSALGVHVLRVARQS